MLSSQKYILQLSQTSMMEKLLDLNIIASLVTTLLVSSKSTPLFTCLPSCYMNISQKAEIITSITHIGRFSKLEIPICNSEAPETLLGDCCQNCKSAGSVTLTLFRRLLSSRKFSSCIFHITFTIRLIAFIIYALEKHRYRFLHP